MYFIFVYKFLRFVITFVKLHENVKKWFFKILVIVNET